MWKQTIQQIHANPAQAVLAVTGGGMRAITDLLTEPGASATVLEVVVPYSEASLAQWLRSPPTMSCSRETALSMASLAFERAMSLAQANLTAKCPPLIGVGCTAALIGHDLKRGDHRCWVATHSETATCLYSLTLTKGERDRGEEDSVVAKMIVNALSESMGLQNLPVIELRHDEKIVVEKSVPKDLLRQVRSRRIPIVWSMADGSLQSELNDRPTGLVSGAFNPLHSGHIALRTAAEEFLGRPVFFELPIFNADKPPLDFLSIDERRHEITECPLALTNSATFAHKARALPDTVFVVGVDTAFRIVMTKYYSEGRIGLHEALVQIRGQGCSFLVAGREMQGRFQTLDDVAIPHGFVDLFQELPENIFRVDISSTDIRHRGSE